MSDEVYDPHEPCSTCQHERWMHQVPPGWCLWARLGIDSDLREARDDCRCTRFTKDTGEEPGVPCMCGHLFEEHRWIHGSCSKAECNCLGYHATKEAPMSPTDPDVLTVGTRVKIGDRYYVVEQVEGARPSLVEYAPTPALRRRMLDILGRWRGGDADWLVDRMLEVFADTVIGVQQGLENPLDQTKHDPFVRALRGVIRESTRG